MNLKKINLCQHLDEVGETYGEHMRASACIGLKLLAASIAQLVHAIFPFVCPPFKTDVRSLIEFLSERAPTARKKDKQQEKDQ